MGEATRIEWCDHTWSPWRGCAKVSPGCDHCYAEALSFRNPKLLGGWGPGGNRALAGEAYWKLPEKWDKAAGAAGERRRIFFSLGDWLEDRPDLDAPRLRLLNTVARTPNLDWLLLTKRPENFDAVLRRGMAGAPGCVDAFDQAICLAAEWIRGNAPRNVWFGVSGEDQPHSLGRVAAMANVPARVRFLSAEPLLGPLRLDDEESLTYCNESGLVVEGECAHLLACREGAPLDYLDWVIVGGESGPNARPCDVGWVRSVVGQCRAVGVPVFVKQLGAKPGHWAGPDDDDGWVGVKQYDKKGGDPSEWPADLRAREFPSK